MILPLVATFRTNAYTRKKGHYQNRWLQPQDSTLVLDTWPNCVDPALRPMEQWGRWRRGKTAIELTGGSVGYGRLDLTVTETHIQTPETYIQTPETHRYGCCGCSCWRGTFRFHCLWRCTPDWTPVRKNILRSDLDHTPVLDQAASQTNLQDKCQQ